MAREVYQKIIELVLQAADMARSIGIENILQPGLIKEMIIAEHLGHQLITTKRDADACSYDDPLILYEYLSCKEGGAGQFDRMFKEPLEKRQESLYRIRRNTKIYLAVFYARQQTKVKVIYELDPEVVIQEAERQLDVSRNSISHVSLNEKWVSQHGSIVYREDVTL
ncbi:MAG: hypothetical protein ACKN9E_10180 [Microcystaceae cyanobacterium]